MPPLSLLGLCFCIHHHIGTLAVSQSFSPHFTDEQTEAKSGWDLPEEPHWGRGVQDGRELGGVSLDSGCPVPMLTVAISTLCSPISAHLNLL